MPYTVDNLQIEVATQSGKAVNGLRALTGALRELKSVTSISLPAKLADNIKAIGEATKGIETNEITKIEKLGGALQSLVNLGSSANGLKSFTTALKDFAEASKKTISAKVSENLQPIIETVHLINEEDVSRLERMTIALKGLSGIKGSLGISKSDVQGVKNVSEATEVIKEATSQEVGLDDAAMELDKIELSAENIKDTVDLITAQALNTNPIIANITKGVEEIKQKLNGIKTVISSIGRVAFYRAIRTVLKEITQTFTEGLKNAYAFSSQDKSFTRLAEALDKVASHAERMRNQLGAMLGELLTSFEPLINRIIDRVTNVASYFTELFAALAGEDTFLQAQLTSKYWDEATANVKKYKQQLLGIDEINNLTKQKASGSGTDTDVSDLFKEVQVSEKFKAIASIKDSIIAELEDLSSVVTGLEIAFGLILLFSGANIPLGLGFLAHATYRGITEITENWDGIGDTIEKKLGTIEGLFGGVELGLGAVLAFSGASLPLGIGLMLEGAKDLGIAAANLKWTELSHNTKKKINKVQEIVGLAELGIGAILAFSGANIPLGIGLMISGAKTWGDKVVKLNWEGIKTAIDNNIAEIETAIGLASGAIGAILVFTGANIGLGLGMLLGSGLLVGTAADWSWNGLLSNLQSVFGSIKTWWSNNVSPAVSKAVYELESLFQADFNGDGVVGYKKATSAPFDFVTQVYDWNNQPNADTAPRIFDTLMNGTDAEKHALTQEVTRNIYYDNAINTTEKPSLIKKVWEDTKSDAERFLGDLEYDFERSALGEIFHAITKKASGGYVSQGTLFYAGEAGPEFVGNMGGQTAVANTDQMGEAIESASYRGMARALQEYGGTVVLSPDTDKLFNVVKQKGREYTRMTGQSWAY